MKTPVKTLDNPFPHGPVRVHPRASIFVARRRQMKHDIRERIKATRRALAESKAVPVVAVKPPQEMSVKELRALAKDRGITGYSKMAKPALVAALTQGEWS
jgi:hypothetical protein